MNEPTRLRDDGSEEVRALLHAGSATRAMTREERDRTGARIDRLGRGYGGLPPS